MMFKARIFGPSVVDRRQKPVNKKGNKGLTKPPLCLRSLPTSWVEFNLLQSSQINYPFSSRRICFWLLCDQISRSEGFSVGLMLLINVHT